ncbi:MAG: FlgD immunoglobulin-like domain containing protein [Spirochaetales bacterium]
MNNLKTHIYFIAALLFFAFANLSLFAKTGETIYISPNNDGVQDQLQIPLSIQDKRYISEWNFIITDESGNIVRTIGNKVALPEKMTIANFFKQLFTPKQGVTVPETLVWNGITDSGETAPDGVYKYYVQAGDDNGNMSQTPSYTVIVDNTEPTITLIQPDREEKTFGGGNRQEISIEQTGSPEDLWTASVIDASGNIVRSFEWQNGEPDSIVWDGTDDNGVAVSEGVYSYRISATDRAGNVSDTAQITNIIYDAIPRAVNLAVQGSPFSPNGDGVQDTVRLEPSMSTSSGLLQWSIDIQNDAGTTVRSFTGTDEPPQFITFDGKAQTGQTLADGNYKSVFSALFNNGQESVISRNISIDNTLPTARVQADKTLFSPDGDGRLDTLIITQTGSREKTWTGNIIDESGNAVKTWSFGEAPTSSIEWNGVNDAGQIIDGIYTYVLTGTDIAGNTRTVSTSEIELNTGTTEVILTANTDAFNPKGNGVYDNLIFTPLVRSETGIAEYALTVTDTNGHVTKTFRGTGNLPSAITWDGSTDSRTQAPDGMYTASLYTVSNNGSEATVTTQPFEVDTYYPEVVAEPSYTLFSPNGDGQKDTLPLYIETSTEKLWTASIITQDNNEAVRSFAWDGNAQSFEWDGTDESGNPVPDGAYDFIIESTDNAGNSAVKIVANITVDNRTSNVYVTVEHEAFSPNNDGILDEQLFTIRTTLNEGIESWDFAIIDITTGQVIQNRFGSENQELPEVIVWDGKTMNGTITDGVMTAQLTLQYAKGDTVSVTTAPFLCSITPPKLSVTTAPEYFSPDNDGVDDSLFINLKGESIVPLASWSFEIRDPQNGKVFWQTSGKSSISEVIEWDGRGNNGELVQSATDYPYVFTVTDTLGMTSILEGMIPVDVLVIREGDVLKIQVPSIIFRGNHADFVGKDVDPIRGLEQSVIDNNNRVIQRIAEILNKFDAYNVVIEGHANNTTGTEEEETSTANGNIPLVPLSEERAEAVKDMLIAYNVNASRLSTVGRGGRMPVVPLEDVDNWWKNRRVEFILEK